MMGLFRGRPKKEPEKAQEPAKTPIVEMTGVSKFVVPEPPKPPRLAELMATEFVREWQGTLSKDDIAKLDADNLTINILFAIYGELRLIRDASLQSSTSKEA